MTCLLKNLIFSPKPTSNLSFPHSLLLSNHSQIMNSASRSESSSKTHRVPELTAEQIDTVADKTFSRYSTSNLKRNGVGVAIVWFRNDLRVLDNEVLHRAWTSSEAVLPVYCVDPRHFGTTHYFGFPKTGALRAQFLIECLDDLKKNLVKRGLDLLIQHGKPEDILPSIAKTLGAHTVYAHKETCSEELFVENLVKKGLQRVVLQSGSTNGNSTNPKLQLIWGSTMYHIEDLPFSSGSLPDVYTHFRKSVETKSNIRGCYKLPMSLGSLPIRGLDEIGGCGCIPSLHQLGLQEEKCDKGMCFVGGESAALSRVHEYFWKKDLLKVYKETRNGLLGPDYSTKFSPWLAFGNLSPRYVYEEVKRYETERTANNSTYWYNYMLFATSDKYLGNFQKNF